MRCIVLEGCDGTGKSTVSKILATKLTKMGYSAIAIDTVFYGNDTNFNALRVVDVVTTPNVKRFLWIAALQYVSDMMSQSLKGYDFVILDRYTLTQKVYDPEVSELNEVIFKTLHKPDLTVILRAEAGWLKRTRPKLSLTTEKWLQETDKKYLKEKEEGSIVMDVYEKLPDQVADDIIGRMEGIFASSREGSCS